MEYVTVWTLWMLGYFCEGQPILTGPTESFCPGELLTYTCNSSGITLSSQVFIQWNFIKEGGEDLIPKSTAITADELINNGPQCYYNNRFVIIGSNFLPDTIVTKLQANASFDFDGATVLCSINGQQSNTLLVSIRGPSVLSLLEATSWSVAQGSLITLISWTSTPEADSYTVTVTPPPPGQSGSVMSSTTNVTVSLSYNQSYSISVYGVNCGMSGESASVNYTAVQCDEPGPPENGAIVNNNRRVEGATLMFQCNPGFTPVGLMTSVCIANGTWSPNPEKFVCSRVACHVLSTPLNGSNNFSSEPSPVGTRVQFQCDPGLFPEEVRIAVCLESGQWDSDLNQLVCRERPVKCSVPSNPMNGAILNLSDFNTTEGSVISFQCDPGFLPAVEMSTTCNISGFWSPDPAQLTCRGQHSEQSDSPPIGPIVGGVVGGFAAMIVVMAFIILAVVTLKGKVKSFISSNNVGISKSFQSEYSKQRQYSLQIKGAVSAMYDDVKIDSELVHLNMNNNDFKNRQAPVEPVVYADLGVHAPMKKKHNDTTEVDQHTVTYSTVDFAATNASAAPDSIDTFISTEKADKLLNIDQALVQLMPVQSRWQELAEALGVPEILIQQVAEHYSKDPANAMTEVVDYWMRKCNDRPTWRELADALNKIKEKKLAKQLMSVEDTGQLPVKLDMDEVLCVQHRSDSTLTFSIPICFSAKPDAPGAAQPFNLPTEDILSPPPIPPFNKDSSILISPPKLIRH